MWSPLYITSPECGACPGMVYSKSFTCLIRVIPRYFVFSEPIVKGVSPLFLVHLTFACRRAARACGYFCIQPLCRECLPAVGVASPFLLVSLWSLSAVLLLWLGLQVLCWMGMKGMGSLVLFLSLVESLWVAFHFSCCRLPLVCWYIMFLVSLISPGLLSGRDRFCQRPFSHLMRWSCRFLSFGLFMWWITFINLHTLNCLCISGRKPGPISYFHVQVVTSVAANSAPLCLLLCLSTLFLERRSGETKASCRQGQFVVYMTGRRLTQGFLLSLWHR